MDDAVICPGCSCARDNRALQSQNDSSSFGGALLGFCVPVVGHVLYLVWRENTPLKAKSADKGALVGVILSVIIYAIYAVIIGAAIGTIGFSNF